MIAYVGYAGRAARFARSHGSIATGAVALCRARGDLLDAVRILLDAADLEAEPMRLFALDEHRTPVLPDTHVGLAVMADLELRQMAFFAPVGWSPGSWAKVGALPAGATVALGDVESIEAMLHLAFRPHRPVMRRTVRAVRT